MKKLITMIVGGFLAAISVLAETRTWIKTDSPEDYWGTAWSNGDGANWQGGVKPTASDTASFMTQPDEGIDKVNVLIQSGDQVSVDTLEGLSSYDVLFHNSTLFAVRDPSQFFGAFRVAANAWHNQGYNGGQLGVLSLLASETHVPVVNTYDARFISEVCVPWGTMAEIRHVVNTEPGFFMKEDDNAAFAGDLSATFDQGVGQYVRVNAGSLTVRETERPVDLGGAILKQGAMLGVAANETAKVGTASGEGGTVVKSGEGKLKLGSILAFGNNPDNDCYPLPSADISVVGGSVGTMAPIAIDEQLIVTDPFLHLDASAEGSVVQEDGTVVEWKDVSSSHLRSVIGLSYPAEGGRRPVLVADAPDGKPYMDCGMYADTAGGNPGDGTAGYFRLMAELDQYAAKAGFFVIRQKEENTHVQFLGDSPDMYNSNDPYGFLRGDWGRLVHAWAWGGGASFKSTYGDWRVDGVSVDVRRYRLAPGEFHLVSFAIGEAVNQYRLLIGGNQGFNRFGGLDIAEVVLFDQALADGEREALEKRLMEKWLDRTHPLSSTSVAVGTVSFASGVAPTVDTDKDMSVDALVGSGTLVKEGAATLTASSASGIDGVDVRGGVLDLSLSSDISVLGEAYLHFDPSDESTLTKAEDGRVVKIEDLRGNGRSAVPSHLTVSHSPVKGPALIDGPASGFKLLDFGVCGFVFPGEDSCGMRWSEDHTAVNAAVIVVNKVGNGEVPGLLGDSDGTAFATVTKVLTNDSNLRKATWLLDGEPFDPTQTDWPQGLHVIAFNIPAKDASGNPLYGVPANMFAQDRDEHVCNRIGGLGYGEMAVFNRALTPAELTALSNHFTEKWLGQLPPPGLVVDNLSVAAGSTFKLSGGLGIQDNSSVSFGFAKSAPTPVEVTGGVQLGENVVVTIPDGKGRLPILKADAFTGTEALKTWTLNGESRRFEIADGVLYAKCSGAGMMIIIR